MKIKSFKEFLNEADLSEDILKIKSGDTFVVTKDFTIKDVNFKKTSTNWFGSNVVAYKNFINVFKGLSFTKDQILFIATSNGYLSEDNNKTVFGYKIYNNASDWNPKSTSSNIDTTKRELTYSSDTVQLMLIALQEGWVEIVPYKSISNTNKYITKFQNNLRQQRIFDLIDNGKSDVLYNGFPIIKIELAGKKSIRIFYIDKRLERKQSNETMTLIEFRTNYKELFTYNSKQITGDPFIEYK